MVAKVFYPSKTGGEGSWHDPVQQGDQDVPTKIASEYDVFKYGWGKYAPSIGPQNIPEAIRQWALQGNNFTNEVHEESTSKNTSSLCVMSLGKDCVESIIAFVEAGGTFPNAQNIYGTSESMFAASRGTMQAYHDIGKGQFTNKLRDDRGQTDASYVQRDDSEDLCLFMDLGGTFFDDDGQFLVDNEGTPVWEQELMWNKEDGFQPEETKAFIIEYAKSHDKNLALKAAQAVPLEVKFPYDPQKQFDAVKAVFPVDAIKQFKREGRTFDTEPDAKGWDCGMWITAENEGLHFPEYLERINTAVDAGIVFTDRVNEDGKGFREFVRIHTYRYTPQEEQTILAAVARGILNPRPGDGPKVGSTPEESPHAPGLPGGQKHIAGISNDS